MSLCIVVECDTKVPSLLVLRLRSLLHLHGIVNNQIHEFIETLGLTLVRISAPNVCHRTYPYLPFYSYG